MGKLDKLIVEEALLQNLPLFYNNIQYNSLINVDDYSTPKYSEKFTCYIPSAQPGKLISKIIDFSVLNEDI